MNKKDQPPFSKEAKSDNLNETLKYETKKKVNTILDNRLPRNEYEAKNLCYRYKSYILGYKPESWFDEDDLITDAENYINLINEDPKILWLDDIKWWRNENRWVRDMLKCATEITHIMKTTDSKIMWDFDYFAIHDTHKLYPISSSNKVISSCINIFNMIRQKKLRISISAELDEGVRIVKGIRTNWTSDTTISPTEFIIILYNLSNAARFIKEQLYEKTNYRTEEYR